MARDNGFNLEETIRALQGTRKDTKAQEADAKIFAELDRIAGTKPGDDSLVFEGNRFVLPEAMEGDIPAAAQFLSNWDTARNKKTNFSRVFNYRPWDGAAAFQRAMIRVFGTAGLGMDTVTFFGSRPPEQRTVAIGHNETTQVPWGEIEFSPLDAEFELQGQMSSEYGPVFYVSCVAPKRHRGRINTFFDVIAEELKERSIYKGKAVKLGADANEPTFLDLSFVDPNRVVYAADTFRQLQASIWSVVEHTEVLRSLNQPTKRTVLLEGPYGTGKSLAGLLTALKAIANGWTFIHVEPGSDLIAALGFARIYGPSVVWFEDIDTKVGANVDAEQMSRVLEALDGVTTKMNGLVVGFTTNNVERIPPSVLRPGRIDTVIHVGAPDRPAFEALIESTVDADLRHPLDYDVLFEAMDGFLPAFIVEACGRAVRYAVSRTGGRPDALSTQDLVDAAIGLRAQLELQQNAPVATDRPALVEALSDVVAEQVKSTMEKSTIVDGDGDAAYGIHSFRFNHIHNSALKRAQRR